MYSKGDEKHHPLKGVITFDGYMLNNTFVFVAARLNGTIARSCRITNGILVLVRVRVVTRASQGYCPRSFSFSRRISVYISPFYFKVCTSTCDLMTANQMRRFTSHPDDVFHADVKRPDDRRPRPMSFEEESHRRLCAAVIDGKTDVLRSLLAEEGLNVNARNNKGETPGHQVSTTKYFFG